MNLLILNYLFLAFWALVFRGRLSRHKRGSALFLIVMTIQLSLVVLCAPVFSDAIAYGQHAAWNWYSGFEPGYALFSQLVWSFWPSPKALMFFSGLAFQISFALFCWRYSGNFALSYFLMIALGFFGMSLFILRQTIALSIALFSYRFVEERRLIPFLLTTFFACLFHKTAVLLFLLYPVVRAKRGLLFHLASICGALVLLIVGPYFAHFLISMQANAYEVTQLSGVSLLALMVLILVFYDLRESKGDRIPIGHSLELGAVLQTVALRFSTFTRATRFFFIAATVAIPRAICSMNDQRLKLLFSMIVVLLGLIFNACIDNWGVYGAYGLFEFSGFVLC